MSDELVKNEAVKLFVGSDTFTQVDHRLYDFLNNFKWSMDKGYVKCTSNLKERRLHRMVMLAQDGEIIDHIDGNPLNNCTSNLRVVTRSENQHNRLPNKFTRSGYKGVVKHGEKWRAQIRVAGKLKYFGFHTTPQLAAQAYNKAAKSLFGIYAKLNNI